MKSYKIASIPGDGIGVEVVDAGLRALHALAERAGTFQLDVTHFDWGTDRYKREGALMPADGAQYLIGFDAILFGAVGAPDVPDHMTLWGLRLNICQPLDQYANVRPTRILPGINSPLAGITDEDLDWVIVRENSEGEYSGHYIRTPYAYQPKLGRKYIPPLHVDLGQGLVQLIEEIKSNSM